MQNTLLVRVPGKPPMVKLCDFGCVAGPGGLAGRPWKNRAAATSCGRGQRFWKAGSAGRLPSRGVPARLPPPGALSACRACWPSRAPLPWSALCPCPRCSYAKSLEDSAPTTRAGTMHYVAPGGVGEHAKGTACCCCPRHSCTGRLLPGAPPVALPAPSRLPHARAPTPCMPLPRAQRSC